MAGKREIKTELKLTGENQFKKGMSDAASAIKVLNSEQKLAQAQFEATGDAEQYAADKARILREKINEQKKAVESAEAAVKALKEGGVDPNSKAMATWRTKLNLSKTALVRMERELNDTEKELGEQGQAFDDTTTDAVDYKDQMDKIAGGVDFTATITAIDNVRERIGTIIKTAGRAATSMWNLERGAAGWADELQTNADVAGLDVETYQGWVYASNMIDSSVDTIRGAYKRLNSKLDEPTDEILKSLNEINVANLDPLTHSARETMDVFWDVVDALGKVENTSRRDQIAMDLFGRSFDELLPLVKAGSAAYKDFIETGKDKAVTQESIDKLTSLDDTVNDLEASFDQTKYTILAELAPAFEAAASAATDALGAFNEFISSTEGQEALSGLRDAIADVGEKIVQTDWQEAMKKAEGLINGVINGLAWLVDHGDLVVGAIGAMAGAWGALTVSKDVLSVLQLVKSINWGQVKSVAGGSAATAANAATNTGTAAAAKAAGGIGVGATVAGTAALAGVGLLFKAGSNYSAEHGRRGSVDAINRATDETAGMKEAFIEYVTAQRELQSMIDSWNVEGEDFDAANQRVDDATAALEKMDGYQDVLRAYNDWRQEFAYGGMDWVLPDNLDEFTGLMDSVVTDAQSTADAMPAIGGNVPAGLAQGIYDRANEAIEAATWLGNAVGNAVQNTLQIQSPSRVMMALGEYVSQGFAEGIENNISDVERATSRMVAATTSKPVEISGGAGGDQGGKKMVHVTLMMDGQDVADVITPYVDSNIGATVSRRR